MFDGLELQNVCESPKTHIQHLCKYECYARVSKHSKASIFNSTYKPFTNTLQLTRLMD